MSFVIDPLAFILIRPKRKFDEFSAYVTVQESTIDKLTITKQPVQQGASISDHAFKEPTQFTQQILFEDNILTSLSKVYQKLLDLQSSFVPFDVITPKRIYHNMLINTLGQTTDKKTENCLSISITFEEVIIVKTSTTTVPRAKQKNAGATGATQSAGKKSALLLLVDAVKGVK